MTTLTHNPLLDLTDPADDLSDAVAVPATTAPEDTEHSDGVLAHLHHDEAGAQAMEYAALAGGGCGVVGILIALLQSEPVQGRLSNLLTTLFDQLGSSLGGLLGF